MGDCLGCPGFTNTNTELEKIRADAKKHSLKSGEAVAIFKDNDEYKYSVASEAFKNKFAITEIVTNAK